MQQVSYEEIAVAMDIPLGTVKSRLHRARQALKAKLAPYFYSTQGRK
jgi:RNA polymerase sigma-70 factor (ECF subfamily)